MAPYVPEEINVFSVPHSRMKELVNGYFDLIQTTNFSNTVDLEMLLESLYRTFTEFKSHEQIENKLIVRKLRSKMRMLSVNNAAVCNCHKGSRLSEMLRLLEDGFNKITDQDRINYGIKLQKELMEFTTDSFLPHMQEEEELFQPLLLKYFSYKELCSLRQQVIQQHLAKKDAQRRGLEKAAWDDLETEEGSSAYTSSESEDEEPDLCVESRRQRSRVTLKLSISDLPPELILKVFQYLSPRELCRCALVCRHLNRLAMDQSLWKSILPVQWSKGNFSFFEVYCGNSGLESSIIMADQSDEDADIDESGDGESMRSKGSVHSEVSIINAVVAYLLPKVGCTVEKLVLANGRKITDKLVRKFLVLCPNVKYIDLSQTNISDAALVSFGHNGFTSNLSALILSGCSKITDTSLIRLGLCLKRPKNCRSEDFEDLSMKCLVLCGQRMEMCKNYVGQRCRAAVKDGDVSRCRLKLFCSGCLGLDENRAQMASNCSNNFNGFYAGTKKVASCAGMDSCELFKLHCDDGMSRVRSLRGSLDMSVDDDDDNDYDNQSHSDAYFPKRDERTLEILDLSGCFRITDVGLSATTALANVCIIKKEISGIIYKLPQSLCLNLRHRMSALFRSSYFPFLNYLDLSGCMQLTAVGLNDAVAASPSLEPNNLFYCDSIIDGPYADEASGCRNLECSQRACCRSGNWYVSRCNYRPLDTNLFSISCS